MSKKPLFLSLTLMGSLFLTSSVSAYTPEHLRKALGSDMNKYIPNYDKRYGNKTAMTEDEMYDTGNFNVNKMADPYHRKQYTPPKKTYTPPSRSYPTHSRAVDHDCGPGKTFMLGNCI